MRQAIATVSVTRPWGSGAAYLHDADYVGDGAEGEEPAMDDDLFLALPLLHAQDIELDSDVEELTLTEATVTVTSWSGEPAIQRPGRILMDRVLPTPSGWLSIGDADHAIQVEVSPAATRIRVAGEGSSWGDDQLWIDLCPAE
jgi:hypothetical protein